MALSLSPGAGGYGGAGFFLLDKGNPSWKQGHKGPGGRARHGGLTVTLALLVAWKRRERAWGSCFPHSPLPVVGLLWGSLPQIPPSQAVPSPPAFAVLLGKARSISSHPEVIPGFEERCGSTGRPGSAEMPFPCSHHGPHMPPLALAQHWAPIPGEKPEAQRAGKGGKSLLGSDPVLIHLLSPAAP